MNDRNIKFHRNPSVQRQPHWYRGADGQADRRIGLTKLTAVFATHANSPTNIRLFFVYLRPFCQLHRLNDVLWTRNAGLCLPVYGAASLGVLVQTFRFIFRAKGRHDGVLSLSSPTTE